MEWHKHLRAGQADKTPSLIAFQLPSPRPVYERGGGRCGIGESGRDRTRNPHLLPAGDQTRSSPARRNANAAYVSRTGGRVNKENSRAAGEPPFCRRSKRETNGKRRRAQSLGWFTMHLTGGDALRLWGIEKPIEFACTWPKQTRALETWQFTAVFNQILSLAASDTYWVFLEFIKRLLLSIFKFKAFFQF